MITFSDIVQEIESLPPLSPITIKIQQLFLEGAENVNVIELIRLIESDALLTANVLKFVNAPKYGFSKKIASVSQAVTLLGTEIVYGIVVKYAMHEKLLASVSAYGITNIQFNDMCHLQSGLMMQWFSKVDLRHAQFLTPLALIMETGKLIVAKEVADSSYVMKFRKGLNRAKNISEFEFETFETTSYYISALLFEHWNLEPIFIEILKNLDFEESKLSKQMDFYRESLDVIRTAVNVKAILTDNSIDEATQMVDEMGLNSDYFYQVAHRMKKNFERSKGLDV
jgi:HD-like signal output (HDOD) protein